MRIRSKKDEILPLHLEIYHYRYPVYSGIEPAKTYSELSKIFNMSPNKTRIICQRVSKLLIKKTFQKPNGQLPIMYAIRIMRNNGVKWPE